MCTYGAKASQKRVVEVEAAPTVNGFVFLRERILRRWGKVVQKASFGSLGGADQLRERE